MDELHRGLPPFEFVAEMGKKHGFLPEILNLGGGMGVPYTAEQPAVDYAGNICVIKCIPGLAQAACAAIDSMNVTEVVGTIAGDDTIFMLCRTSDEAHGVAEALNRMISR